MQQEKQNRREFARVSLPSQAEIASSLLLPVANASRGGVFLAAIPDQHPELKLGREVKIILQVPTTESTSSMVEVSALGRIVRVVEETAEEENPVEHRTHRPGCGRGFGLEFSMLSKLESDRYLDLLDVCHA